MASKQNNRINKNFIAFLREHKNVGFVRLGQLEDNAFSLTRHR